MTQEQRLAAKDMVIEYLDTCSMQDFEKLIKKLKQEVSDISINVQNRFDIAKIRADDNKTKCIALNNLIQAL